MANGQPASKTLAKGKEASSQVTSEGSSETQIHQDKDQDILVKREHKSRGKRP